MKNCNISDLGLKILQHLLSINNTIRSLDIRENNIASHAVLEFVDGIHNNYSLTSCLLKESKRDLHAKNAQRLETFGIDTVSSLIEAVEDEGNEFQEAVRKLDDIILAPNRNHNLLCMSGRDDKLYLSGRTKMLPEVLETMIVKCSKHLTHLYIESMDLEELPPALDLLVNLEALYLGDNRLTHLPESLSLLAPNLVVLKCDHNMIKALPNCLAIMKELTTLIANDNHIIEIPVSAILSLSKLTQFTILPTSDYKIKRPTIPAKVVKDERDRNTGTAVLNYMKEIFSGGYRVVNRCKLMFVGDGGVGKTSLAASFKEYADESKDKKKDKKLNQPKEPNVATDGIDVNSIFIEPFGKKLVVSKGDKKRIEFSMWDFAGQEVYYATHQFFLNEEAIYIVVCNMEDEKEQAFGRVEYWLQSISNRAPKAPTIIVCTHWDYEKRQKQPKYWKNFKDNLNARFKEKFVTLIDVYPVSNESKQGVEDILKGLVKIALSNRYKKRLGLEEERPTTWLMLESFAKALKTKLVVPVVEWKTWCELAMNECNLKTEQSVRYATEYLHQVGVVVWFDSPNQDTSPLGSLSDKVILDSEWLTEVFSSVVSAKFDPRFGMSGTIRQGILQHKDLSMIWRAPKFPSYTHPFLLAVLQKFEVLHMLEGNAINNTLISDDLLAEQNSLQRYDPNKKNLQTTNDIINLGRSLIPCLLPEARPTEEELNNAWPIDKTLNFSQIGRRYEFQFLPIGFFSRLMVRLLHSDWQARLFWKYGIVMYKNQSLLKMELAHTSHTLTMTVRGAGGARKMGQLVESIDTLISDWLHKDVQVNKSIPCQSCQERGDPEPYLFPLEMCSSAVTRGEKFVKCQKSCINATRLDQLVPDLTMDEALSSNKKFEYSQIKIENEIGRGGFAVVYRGILKGSPVAVKQLLIDEKRVADNTSSIANQNTPNIHNNSVMLNMNTVEDNSKAQNNSFSEYFAEFKREVWLMSALNHKNIVQLVGICTTPLCMILEFCGGGNLYDWLHNAGVAKAEDMAIREKLILDVCEGGNFLHTLHPPVIHRDLKSPNILLSKMNDGTLVCKIADFGLSRGLVWNGKLEGKVVDNPIWLAPEILKHQPYSEKVDVYALGIIMWEIITGQDVFGDISFMSAIEEKIKNGERPPIPTNTHIPEYFIVLMKQCWDTDPSIRPSFAQCIKRVQNRSVVNEEVADKPLTVVLDYTNENTNTTITSSSSAIITTPPPGSTTITTTTSPSHIQTTPSTSTTTTMTTTTTNTNSTSTASTSTPTTSTSASTSPTTSLSSISSSSNSTPIASNTSSSTSPSPLKKESSVKIEQQATTPQSSRFVRIDSKVMNKGTSSPAFSVCLRLLPSM
eukprot:TRINITY_DN2359_c0_g1_i1.p1 TRINITY_DN2359_c0_g1~~TRINITY_DN2359_c0_g1_i1.p1  ORF type:complete len:1423 (+),score=357.36 TRINITY_DN2359_c0_g1_i1:201-4271(+)